MYASQFRSSLETHYPIVAELYQGSFDFANYPPDLAERNFILWNSAQGPPGEHWRILYRGHHSLDIFDPLGLTEETIKQWDLKFVTKLFVAFNISQIQPTTSPCCGLFCLYFAIHRVLNPDLSMRQLLAEDFSRNTETNLKIIRAFFAEDGIHVP